MSVWRIKSTKYNTYFSGGRGVENPDFVDANRPKAKWQDDKPGWEKYYAERRKRNEAYDAAKNLIHLEEDDVESHMKLMKQHNIDRDYLRFNTEGRIFNTKRAAETKLSTLTKTTKKIRSKASTMVLYGNEQAVRWKIVESRLVDKDET